MPGINDLVRELNISLRKISSDYGLVFIDINETLSIDMMLRPEFTYVGLHLNGLGYRAWADQLNEFNRSVQ